MKRSKTLSNGHETVETVRNGEHSGKFIRSRYLRILLYVLQ
jgi:hypothetical protein